MPWWQEPRLPIDVASPVRSKATAAHLDGNLPGALPSRGRAYFCPAVAAARWESAPPWRGIVIWPRVTTPADPLVPKPTTTADVGASLPAVRLPRIVGRLTASRECDRGQGRYEDGKHAHESPPVRTADFWTLGGPPILRTWRAGRDKTGHWEIRIFDGKKIPINQ